MDSSGGLIFLIITFFALVTVLLIFISTRKTIELVKVKIRSNLNGFYLVAGVDGFLYANGNNQTTRAIWYIKANPLVPLRFGDITNFLNYATETYMSAGLNEGSMIRTTARGTLSSNFDLTFITRTMFNISNALFLITVVDEIQPCIMQASLAEDGEIVPSQTYTLEFI